MKAARWELQTHQAQRPASAATVALSAQNAQVLQDTSLKVSSEFDEPLCEVGGQTTAVET